MINTLLQISLVVLSRTASGATGIIQVRLTECSFTFEWLWAYLITNYYLWSNVTDMSWATTMPAAMPLTLYQWYTNYPMWLQELICQGSKIVRRGAVAQLVECPSKVPVWCSSTWETRRGIGAGKNCIEKIILATPSDGQNNPQR